MSTSGSAQIVPSDEAMDAGLSNKTRANKRHHRDDTIHNAKRILQEETKADTATRTMQCIGQLLDYITVHKDQLHDNTAEVREFEVLTTDLLQKIPDESVLHNILKEAGWGGMRYHYSNEIVVDVTFLLHVLSSLYMSKSQVEFSDDHSVIKSFVPDNLVACYNRQQLKNLKASGPKDASIVQFYGCAVLVDISGFTKLSAALCAKGTSGLDKLHEAITNYLGHCVDIVYEHGGDVISFAGDAIICIFSTEKGWQTKITDEIKPSPNAMGALKCSMVLKEHCTDTLTAHIAISCGDMSFSTFGGFNNEYVYMIVGTCINEIGYCIEDAKSKQCVVTEKVFQHALKELKPGEKCETHVLPSGNRFVDELVATPDGDARKNRLTEISDDAPFMNQMRKFVPGPVLDALETKNFKNCAQLREVTTMFIKLDTFEPATMVENIPSLQKFFFMAQGVLAEAGGWMRQFLIDDKGCVLIAMWGVPSFTYPNNCSRAIYAAAWISVNTKEMDHQVSIGITTGAVFCGNVGSVLRRDYVGIGAKVNMSARLMGKSKGRVFMDVDTYNHLPLDARKPMVLSDPYQLKGIEGDTYAYICPVDGDDAPTLTNLDDEDGKNNIVRLQKNIASVITIQLNQLGNCVNDELPAWTALEEEDEDEAEGGGDSKPEMNRERSNNMLKTFSTKLGLAPAPSALASHLVVGQGISHTLDPMVSFTLVQGPSGSGKTTAANFARRGAITRGIRCIYIQARNGDEAIPLGVIGKLITELIGHNELNSEVRQRAALKKLVRSLFPESDPMEKLMKSKSLKQGLGYKWLKGADNTGRSAGSASSGLNSSSSQKTVNFKREKKGDGEEKSVSISFDKGLLGRVFGGVGSTKNGASYKTKDGEWSVNFSPKSVNGNGQSRVKRDRLLTKLLTLLLQRTPTCIVIVNAHLADELSWVEFKKILEMPVQVAVLMTILTKPKEDEGAGASAALGGAVAAAAPVPTAATGKAVTQRYADNAAVSNIKDHKKCKVLDMVPFGYQEVHYILTNALIIGKKRSGAKNADPGAKKTSAAAAVTAEVVETVLKVSNGNAFWCKSIAEFIVERGVSDFMRSIESANDVLSGEITPGPSVHTGVHHMKTLGTSQMDLNESQSSPTGMALDTTAAKEQLQQNPLYVLVICRLEKLSSFLQIIIKYAAIIGPEFNSRTLQNILPNSFSKNIDKSLELLLESSFILSAGHDGINHIYVFQNYLIRNALYDLTPPSEAAKIHGLIGDYLELTYEDDLAPHFAR